MLVGCGGNWAVRCRSLGTERDIGLSGKAWFAYRDNGVAMSSKRCEYGKHG